MIDDEEQALAQSLLMIESGKVQAITGERINVIAQTLCLHGDGKHALSFARRLRQEFESRNIQVAA